MKLSVLFFSLFSITRVFGFEGIIHCTKTENGITTHFDFYVKGERISVISDSPEGKYRIILDRSANELRLCIDHPGFNQKGYYLYTADNFRKRDSVIIYKKTALENLEIDGETCTGHMVVTSHGTSSVYFGSQSVNLTGFSQFFNDPVYELLDHADTDKLPRRIVSGNSVIYLTAEETTLGDQYFEVPAGYVRYLVGVITE